MADINLKDFAEDFTTICEKIPVEYEKCHKFSEDLKREYVKKLYSRGAEDPVLKYLLDQVKDQKAKIKKLEEL